jgi:hypothetical protein
MILISFPGCSCFYYLLSRHSHTTFWNYVDNHGPEAFLSPNGSLFLSTTYIGSSSCLHVSMALLWYGNMWSIAHKSPRVLCQLLPGICACLIWASVLQGQTSRCLLYQRNQTKRKKNGDNFPLLCSERTESFVKALFGHGRNQLSLCHSARRSGTLCRWKARTRDRLLYNSPFSKVATISPFLSPTSPLTYSPTSSPYYGCFSPLSSTFALRSGLGFPTMAVW